MLVVVALTLAVTVKTYLVQPFWIPSQSMQNTLLVNDRVLVNKLVGHLSQIHRGEIVVFNGAGSWDPPAATDSNPLDRIYHNVLDLAGGHSGQTDYIKRVIGVPGDHISCCNVRGLLTVNGVPLHESSYLYPGSAPSTVKFSIVVPPGRLWVMGDNREDSADSRYHDCKIPGGLCEPWDRNGTIPESKVIGRAFVILWPLSRFRMLWVPPTFSQPALSADQPSTPSQPASTTAASTTAASTTAASPAGPAATSRSAAAGALMTGQLRVTPEGPAMPLAAGAILAVPLTLLERRWRLRPRRRPRRHRPVA